MKKTVFVFCEKELRRYQVSEDGASAEIKVFPLDEECSLSEELFAATRGVHAFDVYLSRRLVYEDEYVIETSLAGQALEASVLKKLLENPLFDPLKHTFVFLPSFSREKKNILKAKIANIFYFDKKWIDIIEALFTKRGGIPDKVGILTFFYSDPYLAVAGRPSLFIIWDSDLEAGVIHQGRLLYSRHIPLMEESVEDVASEVSSIFEKVKEIFPDLEKTVYLHSEPHKMEAVKKSETFQRNDFTLHNIAGGSSAEEDKRAPEDSFLTRILNSRQLHDPLIDLSEKIAVPMDSEERYVRWMKMASGAFFAVALGGFIIVSFFSAKAEKNIFSSFKTAYPDFAGASSFEEALSSMEKKVSFQKESFSRPDSQIFNHMVYCLPRDAKWELLLWKNERNRYVLHLKFESAKEGESFLLSAGKVSLWDILSADKHSDGRVELNFELQPGEKP